MTLTNPQLIIDQLRRHYEGQVGQLLSSQKASLTPMLSCRLIQDSRQIQQGDVFIALSGHDMNGADFIESAISRGACAVLLDDSCVLPEKLHLPEGVLLIKVGQLRSLLPALCQHFYFSGQQPLPLIGITGTNGKTSISHLLAQICELSESTKQELTQACAVIGTMGTGHIDDLTPSDNTTPGITDVYRLFAEFSVNKSVNFAAVAMEVSSHALAQGRVSGLEFETAIFTNLTHEHLDYHGSMEQYFAEKSKLFIDAQPKQSVINVDDSYGYRLATKLDTISSEVKSRVVAYGQSEKVLAFSEYVHIKNIECHLYGLQLTLDWQIGGNKDVSELNLPLYGEFNAENIAAVFATSQLMGWSINASDFARLKPVPGRLELFTAPKHPIAIVDYAHTPDALEASLKAVKRHLSGRLLLVFGCGGDRDKTKRPLMANVAEQYADEITVTNDNPRTESQQAIVDDIMAGFSKTPKCGVEISIELDRKQAIKNAFVKAHEGDVVLIAGKGHESYQIIGKEIIDYDERAFTAGLMRLKRGDV